jgi:hypothetical protein
MSADPYDPDYNCPEDFDKSFYKARPINQWPEKPAEYRQVMNEYRRAATEFSTRFLRIIALALDLDEIHFDYMTRFPMAGMRALHYPPQEVADDVGIGKLFYNYLRNGGKLLTFRNRCAQRLHLVHPRLADNSRTSPRSAQQERRMDLRTACS